jgi:hypothetical protein
MFFIVNAVITNNHDSQTIYRLYKQPARSFEK